MSPMQRVSQSAGVLHIVTQQLDTFLAQEHQRRGLRQTRTVLGKEFLDRVSPIRLIEDLAV